MTAIDPPVCVALDVPDLESASKIVSELAGTITLFKVGLELFCASGPRTVEIVRDAGARVFLDLKVHDIPRTAAAAVREAARLGAAFLTIHGFGGRDMLRAAAETAAEHAGPQLLVVTVLTSMDAETLGEVGVHRSPREQALAIGRIAAEERADGLILSPRELDLVRPALPHLLLATPGVRGHGSDADDHRRVMSAAEAILAGADLVVVGRPILRAVDRAAAAARIVEEVLEAEAQRESRRPRDAATSVQEVEDAELDEEVGGP